MIAVGFGIFFTWPREEKALEEVTAPEKEITPPEGIVWNVPKVGVDMPTEIAIKKALYSDDQYFIPASRELEKLGKYISIEDLKVQGDWGTITIAPRYKETSEYIPGDFVLALLHQLGGRWRVAVEFRGDFCEWLALSPDTLFPSGSKTFYEDGCLMTKQSQ